MVVVRFYQKMTEVFSETIVISTSGFLLTALRPLLHLARIIGLFPWSTSRSKLSCIRLILTVVYYLVAIAYIAAQILCLYLVIIPQVKTSVNNSDGSSTLQAVLFYHNSLLALLCSLVMMAYAKSLVKAVHDIDQTTRLFLTFWTKCFVIILIVILCAALILCLVGEILYGNLRKAGVDILVGYLSATWNMHGAYSIAWFLRIVPFVNCVGVYLLQTVVIVVSLSVGLSLSKLSASAKVPSGFLSTISRPPDPVDIIRKFLETYCSISRDYRMFANAVSMLILAFYLDDLIWILALIDRLVFGVRGTQFVTEWNQGGDWILLFLAGFFLVVRSIVFLWVSDTAESAINKGEYLIYSSDLTTQNRLESIVLLSSIRSSSVELKVGGICSMSRLFLALVSLIVLVYTVVLWQLSHLRPPLTLDFGPLNEKFIEQMTTLLGNLSIAVNCRFKQ